MPFEPVESNHLSHFRVFSISRIRRPPQDSSKILVRCVAEDEYGERGGAGERERDGREDGETESGPVSIRLAADWRSTVSTARRRGHNYDCLVYPLGERCYELR